METLYLTKEARLSREGSTLLVRGSEDSKRRIPIAGLQHVIVAGEAGMTTSLLNLLGRAGVRVSILDWYGNVTGTFEPAGSPSSGRIHLAQANHALNDDKKMRLARAFVSGAIGNMIVNLRYRSYRGNNDLDKFIAKLQDMAHRLETARSVAELMGFEGNARSWYYQSWAVIDERLDFTPRRRRPPNNPINCLISWFNGLAYAMARNEIGKTHLDDSISFLHSPKDARHSLALDLSEIFKPAICDTILFEIVLRDRLGADWFHQEEGVCRLSSSGRQAAIKAWVSKTETTSDGRAPLRGFVRDQAFALERHFLSIEPFQPWQRKV